MIIPITPIKKGQGYVLVRLDTRQQVNPRDITSLVFPPIFVIKHSSEIPSGHSYVTNSPSDDRTKPEEANAILISRHGSSIARGFELYAASYCVLRK